MLARSVALASSKQQRARENASTVTQERCSRALGNQDVQIVLLVNIPPRAVLAKIAIPAGSQALLAWMHVSSVPQDSTMLLLDLMHGPHVPFVLQEHSHATLKKLFVQSVALASSKQRRVNFFVSTAKEESSRLESGKAAARAAQMVGSL